MLRSADPPVIGGGVKPGLSDDPAALVTGRNGGYQVVNLCVLAGARRIVLVAYDMRFDDQGHSHNVLNHEHGHHPDRNAPSDFVGYAKNFRTMVAPLAELGVEVLNATPGSALDAFPKVSLERALA